MFIYGIKKNDCLFSIALKYQVTMDSIRIYNGLTTARLVPGQDLLIPTNIYTVQPGDSLYSITQMNFISMGTLSLINGLHSNRLMIGMKLYLPPRTKYESVGFSFITPSTPEENKTRVRKFASINTYLGVFEYHISEDGTLSTLVDDQQLVKLIRENNTAPLAVITNLTPTGFSGQLVKTVLNSPDIKNNLINNIYNLLKSKNYAGVNIDFELIHEEERDLYSDFLRRLKERLKPDGYYTSVAVPSKTDDSIPWLKGYDYGGIGSAVDFVFLMAYDWHEQSSSPGPVSPINEVRKTIKFALYNMKRNKIILGVVRYGYDWTMSNGTVISAKALSVDDAIQTAMKYQVPIQYSTEYQQPFFHYRDEKGNGHVVWFEDAKAQIKKIQLVVSYGLEGIGAWQVGLHFIQSFTLLNEYLITKRVI